MYTLHFLLKFRILCEYADISLRNYHYTLLSILSSILVPMPVIAPFYVNFTMYLSRYLWLYLPFVCLPLPPRSNWIRYVSLAVLISHFFWGWWSLISVMRHRWGKTRRKFLKTNHSAELQQQSQTCQIFFSNLSANVWNVLHRSGWRKSGIMSALGRDVLENQLTNASRLAFCWVRQAMSAFDLRKLDFRCRISCPKIWM